MSLYVLDRDPTLVNDVSARMNVGGLYEDRANNKRYRYCLFDSGVETVAAGQPVQILLAGLTGSLFTVTNEAEGGVAASSTTLGVGLAVCVVTAGRYGLVLVQGYYPTALKEDGVDTIALGTPLYMDANDDAVLDSSANGSIICYTVAASVDGSTNTVPVWVDSIFA